MSYEKSHPFTNRMGFFRNGEIPIKLGIPIYPPILNIEVLQTGQVPFEAFLPFFIVTS